MTVNEFLNMDWLELNKLTEKGNEEKAQAVLKQMGNVANRRLKRLSEQKLPSPAFSNRAIADSTGFIGRDDYGNFKYEEFQSTGLTDLRDIRHELKYIQSFLASKTSTVKGAKDYAVDVMMRVDSSIETKADARRNMWSYEQSKVMWTAYNELAEGEVTAVLVNAYIGSDETQEIVRYLQKHKKGDKSWESLWTNSKAIMQDIVDIVQGKYSREYMRRLKHADNERYKQIRNAERIYRVVLEGKIKLNS